MEHKPTPLHRGVAPTGLRLISNDPQFRAVEAPRFAPDARSRHFSERDFTAAIIAERDRLARLDRRPDLFAFLTPDPIATLRQRMQRNARRRMLLGTWLPLGAAAFALAVFAVQMLRGAM